MKYRLQRDKLEKKYHDLIEVNGDLSRQLVSNQVNKTTLFFRWFKYKEGFSEPMVRYLIDKFYLKPGHLLDPFSGAGSALFAAREKGWKTTGIELLPVGIFAIKARQAGEDVSINILRKTIDLIRSGIWRTYNNSPIFEHVNITIGAYPKNTEDSLHKYLAFCNSEIKNKNLLILSKFAAFAVLESISFTRKDGQYLRWDSRSGRSYASKSFNKGRILDFSKALYNQLEIMYEDLRHKPRDLFNIKASTNKSSDKADIILFQDSCLTKLKDIKAKTFDFILTSPPYCNRYDYTRTYALELVFLGTNDHKIKQLRQAMLSCTVENKEKIEDLKSFYRKRQSTKFFEKCMNAYEEQAALHEVLDILERHRKANKLNNPCILRMIRNYFIEMSFVIHECARIMKPGAYFVMVNDNVSYNSEDIPVDLILSEFAVTSGLDVEKIWVLAKGKGNSSQQMGRHGRKELRKCVYVWRKPKEK